MGKIIEVNALEDYKKGNAKYALYANRTRVVPSIRDGLKPVARRIIYGERFEEKAYNDITDDDRVIDVVVKSAAVVGTVMKKYHPHGDSSIYDAMKPLSNPFEINQPLLNGDGNWGTAHGDCAAAMRYTETQVNMFCCKAVIGDLKNCKAIIDWKPTYNDADVEPEYLPIKTPLLLINGAFGIGIGMSCSIPGHNLKEVHHATKMRMKNPNYPVILIPEQAMPCYIIDTNWKKICNTGNGKFVVRGIVDIEQYDNNKQCLVIKSLPDRVFLNSVVKTIKKLIDEKKLVCVDALIDDPIKEDNALRYIIVLKKGTDANYIREFLYKATDLQKTMNVSFEVLNDTNPEKVDPEILSYSAYIDFFILQSRLNHFRYNYIKVQELDNQIHTRDAYIKLINENKLDDVINFIKQQETTSDSVLIDGIMKMTGMSSLQAKTIINIKAKKLTKGYFYKYVNDAKNAEKEHAYHEARILDQSLIDQDIIDDLDKIEKMFGTPRKCKVIKDTKGIPEGTFKVVITNNSYIKKIGEHEPIGNIKGDSIKCVLTVSNTENILLFDEQGRVFKLPVHRLPLGDKSSPLIDLRTIIKKCTSNISTIIYEPVLKNIANMKIKHFITVLTESSIIKKMDIDDFLAVPPSGMIYTKLNDGDRVINVSIIADKLDLIVYSGNSAARFNLDEVSHLKRINKGTKTMSGSLVEGLSILTPKTTSIIVITNGGKINKINVLALPPKDRNSGTTKVIKLSGNDSIHAIYGVTNDNIIHIHTRDEKIDLKVSDIPEGSSISAGKKLIPLKNGNSIIKCTIS